MHRARMHSHGSTRRMSGTNSAATIRLPSRNESWKCTDSFVYYGEFKPASDQLQTRFGLTLPSSTPLQSPKQPKSTPAPISTHETYNPTASIATSRGANQADEKMRGRLSRPPRTCATHGKMRKDPSWPRSSLFNLNGSWTVSTSVVFNSSVWKKIHLLFLKRYLPGLLDTPLKIWCLWFPHTFFFVHEERLNLMYWVSLILSGRRS